MATLSVSLLNYLGKVCMYVCLVSSLKNDHKKYNKILIFEVTNI